jgi:hypothetical protein
MEDELTVVAARKEVLTEPGHEEKRRRAGEKKAGDKKGPAVDQRCE